MTLDQFAHLVERMMQSRPPHIRLGQRAFSVLSVDYPEIADKLVGGPVDSFYHNARVPALLAHILEFYVEQPGDLE